MPARLQPAGQPAARAAARRGGRVRVASFNVLNYFTTLDTGAPICGPAAGSTAGRQQRRGVRPAARQDHQRPGGLERARRRPDRAREQRQRVAAGPRGRPQRRHPAGAVRVHRHRHRSGPTPSRWASSISRPSSSPVGTFGVLDASLDPRAITTLNRPALAQTFRAPGGLARTSSASRSSSTTSSLRARPARPRRTPES